MSAKRTSSKNKKVKKSPVASDSPDVAHDVHALQEQESLESNAGSLPPSADSFVETSSDTHADADSPSTGSSFEGTAQPSILKQPPAQPPRPILALASFMLVLFLGAGICLWTEVQNFLNTSPEIPGQSVVVDIEPGMTLAQVADMLERKQVITDSRRFQLLARWEEKGRRMQAGRFLLNSGWTPDKVLDMLASGRSMLYKLTLREGLPWWGIAEQLEKEGFCKAADFKKVIHDPNFLQHWGIPFESAEGFLFPETYMLPHPRELDMDAARSVADRLVEMFWKNVDRIWPEGRPSPSDLRCLVTLASIVEKETSVPSERARVAGVYANRLRLRMLLQADPTVIYGMGRNFKGRLLIKHLEDSKNPYNTYRKPGLPPGPICSFGAAAMEAAKNPEKHKFLYFVATGKGREHTFSTTYRDHNRAVQEYRENRRMKKRAAKDASTKSDQTAQ